MRVEKYSLPPGLEILSYNRKWREETRSRIELTSCVLRKPETTEQLIVEAGRTSPQARALIIQPDIRAHQVDIERALETNCDRQKAFTIVLACSHQAAHYLKWADCVLSPTTPDDVIIGHVEAALRRHNLKHRVRGYVHEAKNNWLKHTPFEIDTAMVLPEKRCIQTKSGIAHPISTKGLAILICLHQNGDKITTRLQLAQDVWGSATSLFSRSVDQYILNLRRAFEAAGVRTQIEAVHGLGYRLAPVLT